MILRPPISTRTYTLFPYTTLFRSVVLFDGELDELFAIFGGLVGKVGGDFLIEEFRAKAFVLPDDRTLVDEVDAALEVAFGADGQIEDSRGRAEALDDRLEVRRGVVWGKGVSVRVGLAGCVIIKK